MLLGINLTLMSSCLAVGPLKFNITDYTGGLPTLIYEPNAWTKVHNLDKIYVVEMLLFTSILHIS
jgi:hypothetical protein